MRTARWVIVSIGLPLVYAVSVYVVTRKPKPVYAFADPTVVTVSDKPGPPIFHAPDPIYPPRAFGERIEGSVKVHVAIGEDGAVANAVVVSGPEPLRAAALADIRQYQFEAKAAETDIDVGFSLRSATRSLRAPEVIGRVAPEYPKIARRRHIEGVVRVVAMVNPEGVVESVQPVSGPEPLKEAALDAVKQWRFRPLQRNGKPGYGTAVVDVRFAL